MSSNYEASVEQQVIIEQQGQIVVTAKPGSGKTFTIVEKINMISKKLLDYQGVIAISFTNKASQELETRCKRRGVEKKSSFYGTIDKFYMSEIIFPFVSNITNSINPLEIRLSLDDYPEYKELKELTTNFDKNNTILNNLLVKALTAGHIFLEICGETALYIINTVPQCLIYLKSKYTHIFIDEYQDCGNVQHHIFLQLVENNITGIAVGDLDQAIYAFSGKYSKFLLDLISHDKFIHLKISKNYRCHKTISDYSLALMGVPNLSLTEESRVHKITVEGTDKSVVASIDRNIPMLKKKYQLSKNNDFAILCRGNESAKRASYFLKTKNKLFIDTILDKSNKRWGTLFNDLLLAYFAHKASQITILDFVKFYFNEQYDKKKFDKALLIIHEIFSLDEDILYEHFNLFKNFAKLVYPKFVDDEISHMTYDILKSKEKLTSFKPATENEVNIMTLHKSKGLEFKCVFLLDTYKWIFPRENIGLEDYTQALNLHYVGVTRAIEACYIMIGTLRYRSYKDDFYSAQESPFLYLHNTPDLRKNLRW